MPYEIYTNRVVEVIRELVFLQEYIQQKQHQILASLLSPSAELT